MSALKAGPAVPAWLAAGLIGIGLGVPGGYYAANWNPHVSDGGAAAPGPPGGGGPGGGGARGGGGGGAAQQHPQAVALIRTVTALDTLEKARGKELSPGQRQKVSAVAATLQTDAALTEEQCDSKLKELNAVLSADQQQVLQDMSPRPGGGRGGGGTRGGGNGAGGTMRAASATPGAPSGGAAGGPGGGGPGGGGMGGGGANMDFDHPFKEGRGRDRLDDLVKLLGKSG